METELYDDDLLTEYIATYELQKGRLTPKPHRKMPERSLWAPTAVASFVTSLEAFRRGHRRLAAATLILSFISAVKEGLHEDAQKPARLQHITITLTELAYRANVAARTLLLPK